VAGGGIVIAIVLLMVLPVAVMMGGAVWSALLGFLLVDDAEQRSEPSSS